MKPGCFLLLISVFFIGLFGITGCQTNTNGPDQLMERAIHELNDFADKVEKGTSPDQLSAEQAQIARTQNELAQLPKGVREAVTQKYFKQWDRAAARQLNATMSFMQKEFDQIDAQLDQLHNLESAQFERDF